MSSASILCLFLAFGLSQALKVQEDNCACINWADAYGDSSNKLSCESGLGDGFGGGEFCGFVTKLHSNVCLHNKFQGDGLTESNCFVSSSCQAENTMSLEKYGVTSVKRKTCSSSSGDKLLVEMPVAEYSEIAKKDAVDQGVMAGYAATRIDKLTKSMSDAEMAKIKASGVPTLIWSMADHFADRWLVKGNEVWVHKFDRSLHGVWWRVTCKEGCTKHIRSS